MDTRINDNNNNLCVGRQWIVLFFIFIYNTQVAFSLIFSNVVVAACFCVMWVDFNQQQFLHRSKFKFEEKNWSSVVCAPNKYLFNTVELILFGLYTSQSASMNVKVVAIFELFLYKLKLNKKIKFIHLQMKKEEKEFN